jgi:hypothetical protein
VTLTPEQLTEVAERLGWDELCHSGGPAPDNWLRVIELEGGSADELSDGDLLLAILNRATEMGQSIVLKKGGYRPDVVRWFVNLEAYSYRGTGPRVNSASGDSALEAAILAVIQLPKDAP